MGVSGQRHAPAALNHGERTPGTHYTGGWVGPRAGLDTEAKSFVPYGDRTSIAQSVVRHYTSWANPAPIYIYRHTHTQTLIKVALGYNKKLISLDRTHLSYLQSTDTFSCNFISQLSSCIMHQSRDNFHLLSRIPSARIFKLFRVWVKSPPF
jgi:hypothetical protein